MGKKLHPRRWSAVGCHQGQGSGHLSFCSFIASEWYNKPTVKNKKDRTCIAKPVRKGPIPVNEAQSSGYITETFEGVDVVVASSNSFFSFWEVTVRDSRSSL